MFHDFHRRPAEVILSDEGLIIITWSILTVFGIYRTPFKERVPALSSRLLSPYMDLLTVPNALGLFALVNLWTFMLFGFDKIRAEAGSWRVSEGTLLAWAFLGGSIGAYAGRALFRHKTRKQPFSSHLHQTAILHVFALALVGGWMLVG